MILKDLADSIVEELKQDIPLHFHVDAGTAGYSVSVNVGDVWLDFMPDHVDLYKHIFAMATEQPAKTFKYSDPEFPNNLIGCVKLFYIP